MERFREININSEKKRFIKLIKYYEENNISDGFDGTDIEIKMNTDIIKSRGDNTKKIDKDKLKLCECGCGEKANYKCRYIQGHNLIGKPNHFRGKKRPEHSKRLTNMKYKIKED